MLLVGSKTRPIKGVNTAPPIIAITMNEPAIFVFGPRPFKPSAKIVGNISDIKKLVRNTAQSPNEPGNSMAMPTSTIFAMLYAPMSSLGWTNFIK